MNSITLSLESRCQIILAGDALERCIEDRARKIAKQRLSIEITPEDVGQATQDFLQDDLASLPELIAKVKEEYRRQLQSQKAA